MIIVTGGAGFIGSNLVHALNERGRQDILVVDDLEDGSKLRNLADLDIYDLVDKEAFLEWTRTGQELGEPIEAIFHHGACSRTTERDGRYMLRNNYEYSKVVLSFASEREIPLLYASSASVYGESSVFKEERRYESPLNPYAYSKFLFDQLVRRMRPKLRSQVVGLRYFNVYGPREQHKGDMASVAFKLSQKLKTSDVVQLFEGTAGYADGEQLRDFVWVGDCVGVNLWFLDHPEQSGIFNVGTGRAQSFNDVAKAVIQHRGHGKLEYIPIPESLRDSYQSFTQADLGALRAAGYGARFHTVEEGVARYMDWLDDPTATHAQEQARSSG